MTHLKISQNDLLPILCDEENWTLHGLDPAKCLYLMGKTGVGKTFTLETYLKTTLKNVGRRINPEEIRAGIHVNGLDYFHRFYSDNLLWDEFGQEHMILHYGTPVIAGIDLLPIRHKRFPILKTHITTNLPLSKIEELYGDRVMSRMFEMFNFIEVIGKDRRKNP